MGRSNVPRPACMLGYGDIEYRAKKPSSIRFRRYIESASAGVAS